MTKLKIAHLHEQGQDLIIAPLDAEFGNRPSADQQSVVSRIQYHATAAGLRGRVVAIWPNGSGTRFIAPKEWHPYVRSISWEFVCRNVNRELSW